MSLSDPNGKKPVVTDSSDTDGQGEARTVEWGTIYTPSGEQTLGSVEHSRSTQWTAADEDAYLERVKAKARSMAAKILEEARAEAEALRDEARNQGYEQGIAEANDELEAFRSGMADSVSAVLSSIEGQCSHIFAQWRADIVEVAKLAVEKMAGVELSGERRNVLEMLLAEAIAALESSRVLTIHVHPDDEPVLTDIINVTKDKYPDIASWRVKADAAISPGGMVVENESSLAAGLVESRHAAVNQILEHLTLPDKLP